MDGHAQLPRESFGTVGSGDVIGGFQTLRAGGDNQAGVVFEQMEPGSD